jgi:DNA-binding HxlR family transcriptional regulator
MMHYRQFCPIAKAAEIIAERWMPLIIHELLAGSTRFNDIRRGVPLMSQTLLSTRLKELERVGIVERRDNGGRAREWHLTDAGKALGPLIHQFGEWGLQYAQDPLKEDDLDVTVLVWNIKRRVDPGVFPGRRTTVHFDFTDAPEGKRLWWLVNERGAVDLCPFDPGFPVDLYVTTDLRTMIAVWFGKLAWDAGVRLEKIEVIGPRQLRERLRSWFLLSPIAMKSHAVPRIQSTMPPPPVALSQPDRCDLPARMASPDNLNPQT